MLLAVAAGKGSRNVTKAAQKWSTTVKWPNERPTCNRCRCRCRCRCCMVVGDPDDSWELTPLCASCLRCEFILLLLVFTWCWPFLLDFCAFSYFFFFAAASAGAAIIFCLVPLLLFWLFSGDHCCCCYCWCCCCCCCGHCYYFPFVVRLIQFSYTHVPAFAHWAYTLSYNIVSVFMTCHSDVDVTAASPFVVICIYVMSTRWSFCFSFFWKSV